MNLPRVLIFGYDELALTALDVINDVEAHIIGVVFPSNRSGKQVKQVRSLIAAKGISLFTQPPPQSITTFVEQLQSLSPDLILVWSFPMILPKPVLELPRLGCVNLHFGLLPQYRGGHAFRWAIANGESTTGVTLHYMDEGTDTGPIIATVRFDLVWDDDVLSVMKKSRLAGMYLLKECWASIATGQAPRIPQDEAKAHYYPLTTTEDMLVNWSATNTNIYNLVRSLVYPFPGAFTFWRGRKLIVRRVRPVDSGSHSLAPGSVAYVDQSGVTVETSEGRLLLQEAELDSAIIRAEDFQATGIAVGDRFENCLH
jgi:methionyl-tRNA formyltransferase